MTVPAKEKLPKKKPAKPRQPERDYSHRALLDKLGVKPEHRVAVLGVADAGFLRDLRARVPECSAQLAAAPFDVIFLAAESKQDLSPVAALVNKIQPAGAVWIVYPKGQSHIREADVFAAGKAAGFTDNKVCRFSETHTALRFVIPVARR